MYVLMLISYICFAVNVTLVLFFFSRTKWKRQNSQRLEHLRQQTQGAAKDVVSGLGPPPHPLDGPLVSATYYGACVVPTSNATCLLPPSMLRNVYVPGFQM